MSYTWPDAGAFLLPGNKGAFTVWSPQATTVSLLINDSTHALSRDDHGYWHITLDNINAGDRYQYQVDNSDPMPDPASRWQPQGVHDASAIADTRYSWTDHNWTGIPLAEMIIYELHTGTFSQEGSFAGIVQKLDYLQQLGINAIELMPVAAFPGSRNWGYDGVFPFAVQQDYGGIQGLKDLVNEAHLRGIAVILDVVYNHLGPEGNYLPAYGPYLTDRYKSVWGNAINFDDAWSDGVRHYFWQNALMWLDEFHIDGLRLDAVHAIWDAGADHFIAALQRRVTTLEKQTGCTKVLIAEFDLNNPRYIQPVTEGGYGLAGQWIDEFHHALHSIVTGEVNGYYEDFGQFSHLEKALVHSYVYTGQYSVHRKKHFGTPATTIPYGKFVVFAQNHDQVGNRLLGDRLTTQLSFEALKLVAGTVLLSPHVPLLFMGEEYGEKNPFQYFVSHTDPSLIEAVRKGRRQEFAWFNWEGAIPDPAAPATFEQCKLSWNLQTDPQAAALFAWYQYLIAFRKNKQVMCCGDRAHLQLLSMKDKGVIGFERTYQQERLLVFLNFNKELTTCHYPLPLSARKIFDSSDERWNGPGATTVATSSGFTMNPESVITYEILFT